MCSDSSRKIARTDGVKADVQRLQDVEAKMREELHERLEAMVLDVEDVINSGERADERTETFETDEL